VADGASLQRVEVVGNKNGMSASATARADEVPSAVEKSVKDARKHMMRVIAGRHHDPAPRRGRPTARRGAPRTGRARDGIIAG
jgi:ribosomal protein S5